MKFYVEKAYMERIAECHEGVKNQVLVFLYNKQRKYVTDYEIEIHIVGFHAQQNIKQRFGLFFRKLRGALISAIKEF